MNVDFSKDFIKTVRKLSGKQRQSVADVIEEVQEANQLKDITDCKKLTSYSNIYRIRIGSYRAFITLHIEIVGDTVRFEYLVSRGQAYSKKMENELKRIDD